MGLYIEDVVVRKVITVTSETKVKAATEVMNRLSASSLVVLSGKMVDGIVTTRDVVYRVVAKGLDPNEVRVSDIASRPVVMLRPETPLGEAIKIMIQRKIKKIPLITGEEDSARLVGLVSLSDIVEYHSEIFSSLWEQILLTVPALGVEGELQIA